MFQAGPGRGEGERYAPATRVDGAASSSTHSYFAKKGEVNEIRRQIRALREKPSPPPRELSEAMKRVLGLMTFGIDLAPIFSDVVALSYVNDLACKKMIYLFITTHAELNDESALMSLNAFLKDCRAGDARVRGLALRSLCALRTREAADYAQAMVCELLGDKDAYVRRAAVLGALRVWRQAPDFLERPGLLDRLYDLLKDPSPGVVAAVIHALEEAMAGEGGMALNHRILVYLVNRLGEFAAAERQAVLRLLQRFEPESEEERYSTLGLLEDLLRRQGNALAAAVTGALVRLADGRPALLRQIAERAAPALLRGVVAAADEELFVVLGHVRLFCAAGFAAPFRAGLQFFYVRAGERPFNQRLKVQLLVLLLCEENAAEVVAELAEYAHQREGVLAAEAARALGAAAARFPQRAPEVLKQLQMLLRTASEAGLPAVLEGLGRVLACLPAVPVEVASALETAAAGLGDAAGLAALVEVARSAETRLPRCVYILEAAVERLLEPEAPAECRAVMPVLLNSCVHLFLKSPGEFYPVLVRVLATAFSAAGDRDLRERACFYYNALARDPNALMAALDAAEAATPTDHAALPLNDLITLFRLRPDAFSAAPPAAAPDARAEEPAPRSAPREELLDLSAREEPLDLRDAFYLSDEEFQARWLESPAAAEEALRAGRPRAVEEIEEALGRAKLHVIATGGDDAHAKLYLYSQAGDRLILVELLVDNAEKSARWTVKCADPALFPAANVHVRTALSALLA